MKLLGEHNAKTVKGEKYGYKTFILYLAPAWESGYNVCPRASEGCASACLYTAGRGKMKSVQSARVRKTIQFFRDRHTFMDDLVSDIEAGIRKAKRLDLTPVFRLNGTSDIRWERIPVATSSGHFENVMDMFSDITFYDYTKISNRRNLPPNYHLTFSRSESNDDDLETAWKNEMNIAVVFDGDLPLRFSLRTLMRDDLLGLPVVDGDVSDLRFLDPDGCIVGLRAKGDGKKDTSGFVIY